MTREVWVSFDEDGVPFTVGLTREAVFCETTKNDTIERYVPESTADATVAAEHEAMSALLSWQRYTNDRHLEVVDSGTCVIGAPLALIAYDGANEIRTDEHETPGAAALALARALGLVSSPEREGQR